MKRWQSGVLATAAALCIALASEPAAAQSPAEADAAFGEGLEPFEADGPLLAVVSLHKQHLRLFGRTGEVAQSRVSTGRKGFETPEGVFSLIERKVEHNSNLYDDASMPFMQRITWSGVAIHEGQVPNYRASHGCIRVPNGFAERLYRTTRLGTRVVIASHDAAPLPISHRMLPQPGQTAPAVARAASALAAAPRPMRASDEALEPAMHLGAMLPLVPHAPAAEAVPDAPTIPNPEVAIAELRQRRAAAEKRLSLATKAVVDTRPLVRPKLVAMGKAEKAHRQTLALARRAEGRAEAASLAVDAAKSDQARAAATSVHFDLLLELAAAQSKEQAARLTLAEATAAAEGIKDKMAALEAERQKVQGEVRALARRLSPMTILVSRQLGRIYLRQANTAVIDLPLAIHQPERPIGTHVFWATDPDGSGKRVSWLGLTLETPGGGTPVALGESGADTGRRGKSAAVKPRELPSDPLATARTALDRIELPAEVLSRLAPTIQAGSTIIVSDLGPSIETGPGTDIVVQTRGEEQAAANIAKFVAKKKAEAFAEATAVTAFPGAGRARPVADPPAAVYRASSRRTR